MNKTMIIKQNWTKTASSSHSYRIASPSMQCIAIHASYRQYRFAIHASYCQYRIASIISPFMHRIASIVSQSMFCIASIIIASNRLESSVLYRIASPQLPKEGQTFYQCENIMNYQHQYKQSMIGSQKKLILTTHLVIVPCFMYIVSYLPTYSTRHQRWLHTMSMVIGWYLKQFQVQKRIPNSTSTPSNGPPEQPTSFYLHSQSNLHKIQKLLNDQNDQKPYLDAKMAIFSLKEGPKWVKKFDARVLNSFIH